MATYYTLLTKIGQASIANAVALNQMVNLTYMAVGDGNGNPTTPNENQTALVREKYRATINQLTVDPDNPNYLVAELIVPTTVGGWSIYEVGVFDDQNQLIAVANFPATYKPELAEGSGRDLIVRIIIQVSNTSVVTLKIDPAITLASQAWVAANYVKKITVAGGTTGQILAKKSNANEDFKWVDPTAAVDVNVFSREETQTLTTGQTIVDLAQLTTDGAAVYVEGIRLRDNQFTVNSSTRLTLATSYPAATKVTVVQNEETSRNAFMLKANNLSDLSSAPTARNNLGLGTVAVQNVVPAVMGGTGATTIAGARNNLGLGSVAVENIVPVSKGGTGAADAESARTNLGITDSSYGSKGLMVFSTVGVTNWTVPDVLKNGRKCEVEVIGGGGAGGRTGGGAAGGGGGGGGGRAVSLLDLTGVSSVAVTVGDGGAGITSGSGDATGNAGGTSSFGSYLSATGGAGGGFPSGGQGGIGTGGDFNTSTGSGTPGSAVPGLNAVVSGAGGGAGAQGQTSAVSYNGNPGRGYGGGGSGAAIPTAGGLGYSGAGYRGVVIVRW